MSLLGIARSLSSRRSDEFGAMSGGGGGLSGGVELDGGTVYMRVFSRFHDHIWQLRLGRPSLPDTTQL